ncbi:MAG: helix-turn-helix transcriptional regulator [Oscillospiraceae bacterium]|nr:helix-turn-helix transcriptional regulator [Oscillospiraceae bacterium]
MEKEIICFEKLNLPIKIHQFYMETGMNYRGMHSHTAVEIVEVKSGILYCFVNDDIIEVNPKQIIFVNSNTGHRLYSENAEITYLQIDVNLLEPNMNDDNDSTLNAFISRIHAKPYLLLNDNKDITELLNKLSIKYYDQAQESRWYIKAYLYELVAFMYSQSFITPLTIPKEQIKKIEQVVHYVNTNFKSPITLDDICIAAKYNKYTICHTFKAVTGSTIFDYINFLRVHYAVEKLRETGNSILDIATECGFASATYFNRVFKSFFGCSPSGYRKRLPKK